VTRIQIPAEMMASPVTNKPIEMYLFLDPLCSVCWDMQPILRKLQVEYGQYFTIRIVLSTQLNKLNTACHLSDDRKYTYAMQDHAVLPSIAVKAAEFQGKKAAQRFLDKIQEYFFLQTKNVTSYTVLKELAAEAQLDVKEFIQDFQSKDCARSFQSDLSITREMEVSSFPTIVFFNENIEDEGIKVSGIYPYDIYVQILQEMLYDVPKKQTPPRLEKLLERFNSVTTSEVADYYNLSEQQAERELKKLVLLQKIERIKLPNLVLWRYKK